MSDPSQSILIVGAGVFGLSTALHLARRGYTDVTVLDRQPYDKNHYDPDDGCDGASADINKVFRTTYGDRKIYQDLALRALAVWREWTAAVRAAADAELPPGLNHTDRLLDECGFMRVGGGRALTAFHEKSLELIHEGAQSERVFVLHDEADRARAEAEDARSPGSHWAAKLETFTGLLGGETNGFLDTEGGVTKADKACVYALHLAKQAGVTFILGPETGAFDALIVDGADASKRVLGVRTRDGVEHFADRTIVACGGWTASVVPEVAPLLETTGGSVLYVDLPPDRRDLWERFGSARLPVWSFQTSTSTGYGGFPITDKGRIKFGYRDVKYTNFETHPVTGQRLSVPRTRYSAEPIPNVPLAALEIVKRNISRLFPELEEFGITGFRMCWYTDSIDNHFVADYVPGYNETLFVGSGGSGHGFKFLPVLGEHFVNQLERVPDEFTPFWRWRAVAPGAFANGLEEGEAGPRVLANQALATHDDWKFPQADALAG
ncbi:hypothetical protein Q5752_003391 [Cryptotrichosporon argae]